MIEGEKSTAMMLIADTLFGGLVRHAASSMTQLAIVACATLKPAARECQESNLIRINQSLRPIAI
jgi:hypothetical protein